MFFFLAMLCFVQAMRIIRKDEYVVCDISRYIVTGTSRALLFAAPYVHAIVGGA